MTPGTKASVNKAGGGSKLAGGLVVIVLLLVSLGIGYSIGQDAQPDGGVVCDSGTVLAIKTTHVDEKGNGTRTLDVGDCDFISTESFADAVDALAAKPPTTTTSTTEPKNDGKADESEAEAEATSTTAAP